MFSNYAIKNFKSHKDFYEYKFEGLTVITGTNSSGKSSIMQSIRLLSLVKEHSDFPARLPFEKVKELKTFKDTLNKEVNRDESIIYQFTCDIPGFDFCHVKLSFESSYKYRNIPLLGAEEQAILHEMDLTFKAGADEREIRFILEESDELYYVTEMCQKKVKLRFKGLIPDYSFGESFFDRDVVQELLNDSHLREVFNFFTKINPNYLPYLSGSREIQEKRLENVSDRIDIHGENTAIVLYSLKDRLGLDGKRTCGELFTYWTNKIVGTEFFLKTKSSSKEEIIPVLMMKKKDIEFELDQIGYGNSQIIPIIVLILSCKKGDLLFIENPEEYLHPKWRSNLVELFYFAVENGVKLVVETHSIEIMNSMRLHIKNKPALQGKTSLYFLENEGLKTLPQKIDITETGKLSIWPDNFIDKVTFEDTFKLL